VPDRTDVTELRLVVTAPDYEEALKFSRDVLNLPERAAYASPGGRVTILEAGRATLELADPSHAAYVDDIEVGQRVAGHIRVAFEVSDTATATAKLAESGATIIARPAPTPWQSLNAPRRPRRPAANPLLRHATPRLRHLAVTAGGNAPRGPGG
jgi:lactoylglutathione lyase